MAHFAQLDENNIVLNVYPVSNEILDLENEEESGIDFLIEWSGGYTNWKQTSYNGKIRKNYAGIGFTYDPVRDAFIPPKPFDSWLLDEELCQWIPPKARPIEGMYFWNENDSDWVAYEGETVA
jgi:hypothetical protein